MTTLSATSKAAAAREMYSWVSRRSPRSSLMKLPRETPMASAASWWVQPLASRSFLRLFPIMGRVPPRPFPVSPQYGEEYA